MSDKNDEKESRPSESGNADDDDRGNILQTSDDVSSKAAEDVMNREFAVKAVIDADAAARNDENLIFEEKRSDDNANEALVFHAERVVQAMEDDDSDIDRVMTSLYSSCSDNSDEDIKTQDAKANDKVVSPAALDNTSAPEHINQNEDESSYESSNTDDQDETEEMNLNAQVNRQSREVYPGAVAVAGPEATGSEDEFTTTLPAHQNSLVPVTARIVQDNEQDVELLQEQLRERDEQLQRALAVTENTTAASTSVSLGKIVRLPAITLSIATALSIIALCNCTFVEAIYENDGDAYTVAVGLWGGCVKSYYAAVFGFPSSFWDDRHEKSGARKVAVASGLIASVVGTAATIVLLNMSCRHFSVLSIRILCATFLAAVVCQFATLAMFGTNICKTFGCKLSWGGALSTTAAFLWLIGSIGIWWNIFMPIHRSSTANASVQIRETVLPDGTKITERITTSIDGTTVIDRTIERHVIEHVIERPFDTERSLDVVDSSTLGGNGNGTLDALEVEYEA